MHRGRDLVLSNIQYTTANLQGNMLPHLKQSKRKTSRRFTKNYIPYDDTCRRTYCNVIFFPPYPVKIFSLTASPECHRAALIRLSVCDYRMQNEEVSFKAEPKGMQINYVYVFVTDGTSNVFQKEKLDKR